MGELPGYRKKRVIDSVNECILFLEDLLSLSTYSAVREQCEMLGHVTGGGGWDAVGFTGSHLALLPGCWACPLPAVCW